MRQEELAEKCLIELVRHVFLFGRSVGGITYEELASRVGLLNRHGDPHPRLANVLGKMGHRLEAVAQHFPEGVPHIQALVVSKTGKNRGIPDDGIKEFWRGYDRLSRTEKENKAFSEWREIADFGSRWNQVLQQLHLPTVTLRSSDGSRSVRKGGESPEHKALKAFIKANPHLVAVESGAEAFEEYALPSLDTVDVLFKTSTRWTAVEVKSSVSDRTPGDYERGLYQTIKYKALLQAMQEDPKYSVPLDVRVILVLENSLPPALGELRDILRVQVIEEIKPQPEQPSP